MVLVCYPLRASCLRNAKHYAQCQAFCAVSGILQAKFKNGIIVTSNLQELTIDNQPTGSNPKPVNGSLPIPRSRLRLVLTGLGGLLIFWMSWQWGQASMLRWSLLPGAIIATAGLMVRIWATGWLCKNDVLTMDGPYAFTRNPLYLGTLMLTLGHGLMSGVLVAPIIFPVLYLLVYLPTMRREEAYLLQRYGQAFDDYRARVPLLLPRLTPSKLSSQQPLAATDANGVATPDTGCSQFVWPRIQRCYKGFVANAVVIGIYILLAFTH